MIYKFHIVISIFLFVIVQTVCAENALVSGGKSPDGRYEVRIYKDSTPENAPGSYLYKIVDTKRHKVIKSFLGGAYADYGGALSISSVLWNPTSHFFTLVDHGTRHSMDLYLYQIEENQIQLLTLPDYGANALGRVDATSGYSISVVKPVKWEKSTLTCDYIFDFYTRKEGRSSPYKVTFTLQVNSGKNSSTFVSLVDMDKPVEAN